MKCFHPDEILATEVNAKTRDTTELSVRFVHGMTGFASRDISKWNPTSFADGIIRETLI